MTYFATKICSWIRHLTSNGLSRTTIFHKNLVLWKIRTFPHFQRNFIALTKNSRLFSIDYDTWHWTFFRRNRHLQFLKKTKKLHFWCHFIILKQKPLVIFVKLCKLTTILNSEHFCKRKSFIVEKLSVFEKHEKILGFWKSKKNDTSKNVCFYLMKSSEWGGRQIIIYFKGRVLTSSLETTALHWLLSALNRIICFEKAVFTLTYYV